MKSPIAPPSLIDVSAPVVPAPGVRGRSISGVPAPAGQHRYRPESPFRFREELSHVGHGPAVDNAPMQRPTLERPWTRRPVVPLMYLCQLWARREPQWYLIGQRFGRQCEGRYGARHSGDSCVTVIARDMLRSLTVPLFVVCRIYAGALSGLCRSFLGDTPPLKFAQRGFARLNQGRAARL